MTNTTKIPARKTPKMVMVWNALDTGLAADNATLVAAARRLIIANRIGWKKYHVAADWNAIVAAA